MFHRLDLAWLPLALSALACDSAPPPGPVLVNPVSGQVTFNGKPVAGALVVFHPEAPMTSSSEPGKEGPPESVTPNGKTDSEGRFQLHSYLGNDGAPVGKYKVTVVLAGPSENRNFMAKNAITVSSVTLPPKYADRNQSGLTATVQVGDNVLPPFEL